MAYGYEIKGPDDRFLGAAKKLSNLVSRVSLPGSLLVNDFPLCTLLLQLFCVRRPIYRNGTKYDISLRGYPGSATNLLLELAMP